MSFSESISKSVFIICQCCFSSCFNRLNMFQRSDATKPKICRLSDPQKHLLYLVHTTSFPSELIMLLFQELQLANQIRAGQIEKVLSSSECNINQTVNEWTWLKPTDC